MIALLLNELDRVESVEPPSGNDAACWMIPLLRELLNHYKWSAGWGYMMDTKVSMALMKAMEAIEGVNEAADRSEELRHG